MDAREVETAAGAPSAPTAERRAPHSPLRSLQPFVFPVVVYVMSRVAVLSAAYFASFMKMVSTPREHTVRAFTSGADAIYRAIAEHGYPATVPARGPNPYGTSPLYPLVLRAVNRVSPLSPRETAIVVSTVLGLAAAIGVWLVARSLFDRVTADRAVLLFCFLPGAYVLSFANPDSLLVLLAAVCLLSLDSPALGPCRIRGAPGHGDATGRPRARGVCDRRRGRRDPSATRVACALGAGAHDLGVARVRALRGAANRRAPTRGSVPSAEDGARASTRVCTSCTRSVRSSRSRVAT